MPALRSFLIILVTYIAIVFWSAINTQFEFYPLVPNLAIPVVFFLAVERDISLARAAAIVFAIGYFQDVMTGTALSLHTFLNIVFLLVTRIFASQLTFQGMIPQIVTTFVLAILFGFGASALRSVFGPPVFQNLNAGMWKVARVLLATALVTAAFSPLMISFVRTIEFNLGRKRSNS